MPKEQEGKEESQASPHPRLKSLCGKIEMRNKFRKHKINEKRFIEK